MFIMIRRLFFLAWLWSPNFLACSREMYENSRLSTLQNFIISKIVLYFHRPVDDRTLMRWAEVIWMATSLRYSGAMISSLRHQTSHQWTFPTAKPWGLKQKQLLTKISLIFIVNFSKTKTLDSLRYSI